MRALNLRICLVRIKEIKNNDKIKKYCDQFYSDKNITYRDQTLEMPLNQLNNSAVLRNKENAKEVDPEQSQNNSPVKQTSANQSKCSPHKKSVAAQINQLKIKLSDRDFQLKRLEEDCSVKMALMQKELTKQKNEKKQLMKESKQKLQEDRHYYETKIVMLEEEWKAKVQKFKKEAVNDTKATQDKQRAALKERYQKQIKVLKAQLEEKQQQFTKDRQALIQSHEKQMNLLQSRHKQQVNEAMAKNEAEINHMKQNRLSELQFYHQLQEQKCKQQNVVSKILSDKIRGLEQEARNLRGQISDLNKEIDLKNSQIFTHKKQKQSYRLDKICLERKIARLEPELKEDCEQNILKAKEQYQQILAEQVSQFGQKIDSINTLYQQSTISYQTQIAQLQERCRQVAALHLNMKSNEQDIKKIEMLEMKLIKREMELQKQRQDTKMCRLELSNMDQMLQKMFEEAKVKSLKARKHKLPSLLAVGQHRTTMDCYSGMGVAPANRESKKFSIREVNYNSIVRAKEGEMSLYE